MDAIPGQVLSKKPARVTIRENIAHGIWWKWMLATVLGMLAALVLAAIPGFSRAMRTNYRSMEMGGPVFEVTGFRLVILFFGMGLLSALPQTWILSKMVKRPYLWLVATAAGALIGGLFTGQAGKTDWIEYPIFTVIPISIAQGIALGIFYGWWRGIFWPIVNFLTKGFFSIFVGFFVMLSASTPLVEALLFSIGIGLPCGFFTGLYMQNTINSANKLSKVVGAVSANTP